MSLEALLATAGRLRVFDLAQPIHAGMPVSPNHPGFKMALQRRHGDMVRSDGGSAANEMMMIGGHTGTHIDALCHVSHCGLLYGGVDAVEAQTGGRFKSHGVEQIPITVCRGVLFDVPALRGVDCLEPGEAITASDLEAAARRQCMECRAGDVALVRSGWTKYWGDPDAYLGHKAGVPGPDESAAAWLLDRNVRMTGGETIAYEWIPAGRGHALLPVHRMFLVEKGVHIMEGMNLSSLAEAGVYEFLFVVAPIKVVGATGMPVRPFALA